MNRGLKNNSPRPPFGVGRVVLNPYQSVFGFSKPVPRNTGTGFAYKLRNFTADMKRLATIWLALAPAWAAAQLFDYDRDAARMSQTGVYGTARAVGMGGAFVAGGGDATSLSLNPGGLALFRRFDLSLTPAVQIFESNGTLLGQSGRDGMTNVSIGGFGCAIPIRTRGTIKSVVLGFGFNQLENFRRRINATAWNENNSFSSALSIGARGIDPASLQINPPYYATEHYLMAFNTFIPNPLQGYPPDAILDVYNTDARTYIGAFDYGQIQQNIAGVETGRNNQWSIAGAVNIDDLVYLGGSLNIYDAVAGWTYTLTETDVTNAYRGDFSGAFDSMAVDRIVYEEVLTSRGSGVNFNLGALVHPVDFLRVGVSFQTPGIVYSNETFATAYELNNDRGLTARTVSEDGRFDYRLVLPYRVNVGVSGIIGKTAMINVDGELVDYRSANVRGGLGQSGAFAVPANRSIAERFALGYNLRAGAEVRYKEFYFRLGAGYSKGVLRDDDFYAPEKNYALTFTGGLGYRRERFYIDVAYSHQTRHDAFGIYPLNTLPNAPRNDFAIIDPSGTPRLAYEPTLVARRVFSNIVFTVGVRLGKNIDRDE